MAEKPKIAICWLGGCGGCDEAVVDINEVILQVVDAFDIVLWPVALDFKYDHIERMNDGAIAFSVINGNVRNADQEEVAKLLRRKSQLVMAFGACACFGGTPGLANLRTKKDIIQWVYRDAPTVVNPEKNFPETKVSRDGMVLTLPELYDRVYSLNQVISVDYYLPGCPPPPDLIEFALKAGMEGKLPPKGTTLAPRKALCETCERNKTKPSRLAIQDIKRIHEVEAQTSSCFLAQGIICMGPATRSGCGESCIKINVPCRGCFGPIEGVADVGAKFIPALASIIHAEDEDNVRRIIDKIKDEVGYFYRFSMPVSILERKRFSEV